MFNTQNVLAVSLCAIVYSMSTIAQSAAQLVAMLIIVLVPVAIAFAFVRLGAFFAKAFSSKKTKQPVQQAPVRKVNRRIAEANRARAISGDEVMSTPAYLRKKADRCYPMTTSLLAGHVVVNKG